MHNSKINRGLAVLLTVLMDLPLLSACTSSSVFDDSSSPTVQWASRDPKRPMPPRADVLSPVIIPPPSDATILFDGTDLSHWHNDPNNGWSILSDGSLMTGGKVRNYLASKQEFQDIQIHLEFMTPNPPGGLGQKRGNSGVFLMGLYELQIMDPINNPSFADGLPGAVFGQQPPLALAARAPGEWQSYDIFFQAPVFDGEQLVELPRVTALLNGVLVQLNTLIRGDTIPKQQPPTYATKINQGPLVIQDHGDATGLVRFRNIWIRSLRQESHGR